MRTKARPAVEKRQLVLEQEFAQVLKVLSREGNTLSPIVRQAWDGDTLQTMVRNNPLRASAAHIGIVGHITKDELLRYLTATELANGFSEPLLADRGRPLQAAAVRQRSGRRAAREVRDAVRLGLRFAGDHRALPLDPAARERWIEIYPHLSASGAGLAGAATARAEAHVVRLALIYALLDCSEQIAIEHLQAALASGATAPIPPPGSSATASATRPPTRSGLPPRSARRRDAHRDIGHVQPQQEAARDRARPRGP